MENTDASDAQLLERIRDGETRALSGLYDRHSAAVARYAWALAADRHDVEEILQDTFVTLWRSARGIRLVDASALPWLLVTCRNHARNLARKRARDRSVPLPDDFPSSDAADARDRLRWVTEAITQLDPVDQRVCELCLVEGRPYKEVAALLGTSVGAIKQRVARSRARLRKAVVENEG
jgi:RNA polymerase sigma-70 factor (ECF subfamily)